MSETKFTPGAVSATCRACEVSFSPSANQIKKHDFICKPCRAKLDRANRDRRRALGLTVSGARMSREYNRAYAETYNQRPEVRARRMEQLRQRMADPIERMKDRVRRQTRYAIATGKLVKQPCEACGVIDVQAHHDDYSKPLDVRWLCPVHHTEHHAKARGELP